MQLGPGETGDELGGAVQMQFLADVVARTRIGRGGHGQPRRSWKHLRQLAKAAVVGAKIVAPLTDAVGLVDGDQGQGRGLQTAQHGRLHQPFGRQIEKIKLAVGQPFEDEIPLARAGRRIQPLGRHAGLLERRHLIAHQGDQRRDDQADAGPDDGRDLVTQALAAAGRQDGHGRTAGQHFADDIALQAAEILMAEDIAKDAPGLFQRNLARPHEAGFQPLSCMQLSRTAA